MDWAFLGERAFWSDLFSFVGLPLALVGLRFTFLQAKESKTAAESARDAVDTAMKTLDNSNAISDISSSHSQILAIKDSIRSNNLPSVPQAASDARTKLIRARKKLATSLNADEVRDLQTAISLLQQIESKSDQINVKNGKMTQIDIIQTLTAISKVGDELIPLIEELKSRGGTNG